MLMLLLFGGEEGEDRDMIFREPKPRQLCCAGFSPEMSSILHPQAQHSKGVLSLSFCRLDDNSLEQDRTAPRLVVQQASYSIPVANVPPVCHSVPGNEI